MLIEVENLSCSLGETKILHDISFAVSEGSYLTVTGPNGVGKTTLLRCLDRIVPFQSGSLRLAGKDISGYHRKSLSQLVAYVQQTTAILPMTVIDFVRMGRYPFLHRLSPFSKHDESLVANAMDIMELTELADRPVENLSGGQRQKVFLAAALVQEPKILLLDEPTTFLDYRRQTEVGLLLTRLNREYGTTIIEVTHDLNHAVIRGQRVLALKEGRVAFYGSPEQLMTPELLQNIYSASIPLVRHPEKNLMVAVPPLPSFDR